MRLNYIRGLKLLNTEIQLLVAAKPNRMVKQLQESGILK